MWPETSPLFVDPLEYSKSAEALTAVDANLFLKASIATEQLGGLSYEYRKLLK